MELARNFLGDEDDDGEDKVLDPEGESEGEQVEGEEEEEPLYPGCTGYCTRLSRRARRRWH